VNTIKKVIRKIKKLSQKLQDLVLSETLSIEYKNLYGSQPENGFMKEAETCRCYNLITF
jgi:hypothetical protein